MKCVGVFLIPASNSPTLQIPTQLPKYGLLWWLSDKESTCQCRKLRLDPWVRKIPWKRKWQPTPVFLPGKSYGKRSLVSYSPWGCKRVKHNLMTTTTSSFLFHCYLLLHCFNRSQFTWQFSNWWTWRLHSDFYYSNAAVWSPYVHILEFFQSIF